MSRENPRLRRPASPVIVGASLAKPAGADKRRPYGYGWCRTLALGSFLAATLLLSARLASAATNLVFNGSFDDPTDPLNGWQTTYTHKGESWYKDNLQFITVIPRDGTRTSVLRLHGTDAVLNVPGQGVKVDSRPVPLTLDGRYKFSARARSTGPCCRILLEGYYWRKGVTPHDNPTLYELQKCYKSTQLFFGKDQSGEMSPVPSQWTEASQVIPEPLRMPPDSPMWKIAKRGQDEVRFVVIHVVAIGGHDGDLFVDDFRIEPLGAHPTSAFPQPKTKNQEPETANPKL